VQSPRSLPRGTLSLRLRLLGTFLTLPLLPLRQLQTTREVAVQLNSQRVGKEKVPPVAFAMFFKKFEPPVVSEGFESVEPVPFVRT